jgi:hypothetical protein
MFAGIIDKVANVLRGLDGGGLVAVDVEDEVLLLGG